MAIPKLLDHERKLKNIKDGDGSLAVQTAENIASGDSAFAEGYNTTASGYDAHAEGYNTTASGNESHAEGYNTTASGNESHAEGYETTASGDMSHAEGYETTASGDMSHAEGLQTTASGYYSHAEGYNTTASGEDSHAEGSGTTASGDESHAEGYLTEATGVISHAEGSWTIASGNASHAEGGNLYNLFHTNLNLTGDADSITYTISSMSEDISISIGSVVKINGKSAIITDYNPDDLTITVDKTLNANESFNQTEVQIICPTVAVGDFSHAEGNATIAYGNSQHTQGKFNITDSINTYAHIVGNGTGSSARSNAHTLDWDGNAWYSGDVYVGSTSGTNKDEGSKILATQEFVNNKIRYSTQEPTASDGNIGDIWIVYTE